MYMVTKDGLNFIILNDMKIVDQYLLQGYGFVDIRYC